MNIGIKVDSFDEIIERYPEQTKLRPNVFKIRNELCMEKYVDKLEKFYDQVLG